MTNQRKPTLLLQFIKRANYDASLFRVVKYDTENKLVNNLIKEWEDTKWIYLKDKVLPKTLIEKDYYNVKVLIEDFKPDDKVIYFVKQTRVRKSDYKPVEEDTGELSSD